MAVTSTQDFIEQMGLFSERSGMPRISGRLLGFLLLDGKEHALDDLAEQLQVSKASISTNARLLEQRGLVTRIAQPGDRRDFYRIVDAPWDQMLAGISLQLQEAQRLFEAASTTLPLDEGIRQRLADWAAFYTFLMEGFAAKIARWRERRAV